MRIKPNYFETVYIFLKQKILNQKHLNRVTALFSPLDFVDLRLVV